MNANPKILKSLEGQLIVSCQASEGDAFRDSASMARFARAAVDGGAAAIRANGPEDVQAIRAAVSVPIIGIHKEVQSDGRILITPSFESARQLHLAGAEIVALDCTVRGQKAGALERIGKMKRDLGVLVFADIATLSEAEAAAEAGADAVLSTLRGYTPETAQVEYFEADFIQELCDRVRVPVIAEGRINSPEVAARAMRAGAFAVIVGTAITRPADITRSFVKATTEAYRASPDERLFVGVDLGGTKTKYGLVSGRGELIWHDVITTPSRQGRQALLAALKTAVSTSLKEAYNRSLAVEAIGVATAGWVDAKAGTISYATENLPGWTGTAVRDSLSGYRLPVSVENDANALAVGEKHFGVGKDLRDFVVVTLGTGVGGGCYIGGRLNRGAHTFANALGHIPIVPDGLPCNCGQRGCLEVYANSAALVRYAGPAYESAKQVIEAARTNEPTATNAMRSIAANLARGCASIVGILDPEAIVLSGGLATNNSLLIGELSSALQSIVPNWDRRSLRVLESKLGYFGGTIGAAALHLERRAMAANS